ncbi:SDR family NAD(P)-dependent oxidoreductase [Burkholderia glumae]|uniref:SDR family NAD(P)-dependent oxidoreductase n=1 Tax=Burkholderia glumae TaxID=337 RepID=UPI0001A4A523|nr:SDR family NAD(P)-dependent oxidoreductase [Burkholderia glumae]ACR32867.1 Short-chain dehydrogenase/reductase SDR [Burkholderia glumae BGR1]MCM2543923.1 SDR family oxidoreductase [Burkholderia glumae]
MSEVHQRRPVSGRFGAQVVAVTGAATGIGAATSRRFAEEGARLVIIDIEAEAAELAARHLREAGHQAQSLALDVSDDQACRRAIEEIAETCGRLDVLVNSAGITRRADVVDTTVAEWDRVLNVNLRAVFLMCKYAVPLMRQHGGGRIVNIASGWGIVGGAKAAAYCASKGGVVLLTKAMAIDHGPDGITVNCVCPGDTDTRLLQEEARQLGLRETALVEQGASRPLGRVGRPEEISAAVAYLASADASFVTGTSLVVDGGGLAGSA